MLFSAFYFKMTNIHLRIILFLDFNISVMKDDIKPQPIEIDEKGSLGLLALGDIGLRAWREVKKKAKLKRKNEDKN